MRALLSLANPPNFIKEITPRSKLAPVTSGELLLVEFLKPMGISIKRKRQPFKNVRRFDGRLGRLVTYLPWRKAIAMCCFAALGCMSGCANAKKATLTVGAGERVTYECEKEQRIVARYYSLSDGSLDFVKVTLPDGKERSLPQVISASGVRYSDDFDLVWWTKGDTAFAETRNEKGEWQITYWDCRAIMKAK